MFKRIGAYAIEAELGRGGAGIVYRCKGPEGETVAVKLLIAAKKDRESLERFYREVRLLGSLGEAQGFVPLVDAGSSPQGTFLVMPLLQGGTLRARLENGPLPVVEAVELGVVLARALGTAHAKGIVHRDMKPENVLFTGHGRPLVADLGLAKHFTHTPETQSVSLSKTGELRGTAGYMAPEQMNDTKGAGPPADVFSLGAIVYECLAGSAPFEADNPHATWALTAAGKFAPLRKARPEVPARIATVVERCLRPDPKARFADGAELARALEEALAPPRARAPWRALAALGGAAAIFAAVLLAVSGNRRPDERAKPRPPPPPLPQATARTFPKACRGFLQTKHLRLASLLGTYQGVHVEPVTGVAFSPDGKLVASCGLDGFRALWDQQGDEAVAVDPSEVPLTAACFLSDGRSIATGDQKGSIDISSTESGKVTKRLNFDPFEVEALGVTRKRIATLTNGMFVRLWDPQLGVATGVYTGENGVAAFALRPGTDEVLVALPSSLELVAGFDTENASTVRTYRIAVPVTAIAISADGARAATGDAGGTVHVWDLSRREALRSIGAHPGLRVSRLAISADGNLAASATESGVVRILDLRKGLVLDTFEPHRGSRLGALAMSPDGRHAATGNEDGRVRLFEVGEPAKKLWRDAGARGFVPALALAPGKRLLAAVIGEGSCRIWNLDREEEVGQLAIPRSANVNGVAVTPDGRRVVTVSHDRSLRCFDLDSRQPCWEVSDYFNNVLSVALSPDGKRVVTGSDEGAVRVFETASGRELVRFSDRPGAWISPVGFLPGGDRGYYCAGDGALHVFDATTGAKKRTIELPRGTARVALVPGTARALVATAEGSARLYDLEGGSELARFADAGPGEPSVAAFPDGRHGVTGSKGDGKARLFDLETGKLLDTLDLSGAHDSPRSFAVAADGKTIHVGTNRGAVLGFEVSLP